MSKNIFKNLTIVATVHLVHCPKKLRKISESFREGAGAT
jgi:hypothetical protein